MSERRKHDETKLQQDIFDEVCTAVQNVSFAFWAALHVLEPVYRKHGLMASIAAHFVLTVRTFAGFEAIIPTLFLVNDVREKLIKRAPKKT